MAGFLPKEDRVIDMVLTAEGRILLSQGKLDFAYWMPFDDEVDYDPYVANSGSLTAMQLSASKDEQLEATLVREANRGYPRNSLRAEDRTNVHRPLFTVSQGQDVLPKMIAVHRTSSMEVRVQQEKIVDLVDRGPLFVGTQNRYYIERGTRTFGSTKAYLEFSYTNGGFADGHAPEGFLVRVYQSGSSGFREVDPRYDMDGQLSFSNDLKLAHLPKFLRNRDE